MKERLFKIRAQNACLPEKAGSHRKARRTPCKSYPTPPPCICVKMEPFPFLVFFPSSLVIFVSSLDILPLKHSVFYYREGHLGGSKRGQMVDLSSKTPKNLKCLQNKGKTKQEHNWPQEGTWLQVGQKRL